MVVGQKLSRTIFKVFIGAFLGILSPLCIANTSEPVSTNISSTSTVDGLVISKPNTVSAAIGGSVEVPINFTSPHNVMANLKVNLSQLPAGWTGPSNFSCDTVSSANNSCNLKLTYKPSDKTQQGVLTLNYSYVDNTGATKEGVLKINYQWNLLFALVANNGDNQIDVYATNANSDTFNTQSPLDQYSMNDPQFLTFDNWGDLVVIANNTLYSCSFNNGSDQISNCTKMADPTDTSGNPVGTVSDIEFAPEPTYEAYLVAGSGSSNNKVYVCNYAPGSPVSISGCQVQTQSGPVTNFAPTTLTTTNYWATQSTDYGYVGNSLGVNTINECTINSDGTMSNCDQDPISPALYGPVSSMATAPANNNYELYFVEDAQQGNDQIYYCQVPAQSVNCGTMTTPSQDITDVIAVPQVQGIFAVNGGSSGTIYFSSYDPNTGAPTGSPQAVATGLDNPVSVTFYSES